MADVHDQATRSKNMRAIRHCDTSIEKTLRRMLSDLELDVRVQGRELPGRPDFVLDDARKVIFTHGCFWHRHDCHLFRPPATRTDFWLTKIGRNAERDRENIQLLLAQGWQVLIIWECAMKGKTRLSETQLSERLEEWICAGDYPAEIGLRGLRGMELTTSPADALPGESAD